MAQSGVIARTFGAVGGLTAAGSPMVRPRPRPGGSRPATPTAGTRPVGSSQAPGTPESIRARAQRWQLRILEYAESVPEVAGAAALVRASIENVVWTVEGTAPAGGKARAQARIDALDKERVAELIWLSGEAYIANPDDPGGNVPVEEVDAPFSLSVVELTAHADPPTRLGPNGEQVDLVDSRGNPIPFMRIWRASKTNRWQAASPNKAAMDLIEAMYLHQLGDTALAKSRLAGAGVVFWPTDAPSIPVKDGEPPDPKSREAILESFTNAAWQAISAQSSREATIPHVVFYKPDPQGRADLEPKMFRIERDDHAESYAKRVETHRTRYATTVELPVESVTGMGGTNHWSAWQIDVDKWRTWFRPLCDLIRVELERRIVKLYGPGLKLTIDAGDLIKKPDQTDVIIKLMQLQQVTPESGLEALKSGKLEDLVYQTPPQKLTTQVAPGQPSDFGQGDTDRGGGKFRDQA